MEDLESWSGAECPGDDTLSGRLVVLEPLDLGHAADLHAAGADEAIWTFLPYGPWPDPADWAAWVEDAARSRDPRFYAVRPL